jgi:hypothetical protein
MSGPYPDRREMFAASAAILGASALASQPKAVPRKTQIPCITIQDFKY